MKDLFKEYLFTKHILVAEEEPVKELTFDVLFTLKNKLGINITSGKELVYQDMIKYAANQLGQYIPDPFYRGFPETVKQLTPETLLFDQLLHYFDTYGCDCFDETGHSYFEKEFERLAFNENVEQKDFEVVTEKTAESKLVEYVLDLLGSSRPLSLDDYDVVCNAVKDYSIRPKSVPCKQTAVRMLYDTGNVSQYGRFLFLSDVIKLVDYINYAIYGNENLKKLNFKNKDRKIVSKVIDYCFDNYRYDFAECCEKKKIWCGLLHHIHYKPKYQQAENFVKLIRERRNISVYSQVEAEIAKGNIVQAAEILALRKGSSSVVIRNLNYLLSRCKTEEEVKGVLSWVK